MSFDVNHPEIVDAVRRALDEDVGAGDITSALTVPAERKAEGGFHAKEPLVVAGLLVLALAITANLAGLFEFSVPRLVSEGSPQGAFATGLLAAFVATPCTGPFMAAAMGAALLLPIGPALALFAALGLGLALVAKIVGDHGGVIEFDSEPRRTVFKVMLPAAASPAEDEP